MFDHSLEITALSLYFARLRQAAEENCATRVERANRTRPTLLARLAERLAAARAPLPRRPAPTLTLPHPPKSGG
jgi:hypothetical protein